MWPPVCERATTDTWRRGPAIKPRSIDSRMPASAPAGVTDEGDSGFERAAQVDRAFERPLRDRRAQQFHRVQRGERDVKMAVEDAWEQEEVREVDRDSVRGR